MEIAVLHHNDADGFGAAYALWKAFDEEMLFLPVQYGQPVPELPESVEELFIVDFSYDRATCQALAAKYGVNRVHILDHHKTAQKELEGLPYAVFDMSRSGAVLAWQELFKGLCEEPVPQILEYVQDRDLWRFELPFSEEVNLYIATLKTFEEWDSFEIGPAITIGCSIKAFRNAQIERALKNVRMEEFAGFTVPVLNLSENISEVGNELCKRFPEHPFSVSYCDRADGKRSYSLRSIGDFDVAALAHTLGGGGHRNAAGFTSDIPGR